MSNHYRTLGVDPQADPVAIRSAYLALIRRFHPDRAGEEADPARAQAVTAAWEVLRDPERRAAYDQSRQARFAPGEIRGGATMAARGPRVRGGAAGRNLFLLLAAGTVGLGWWALQQPHFAPPARVAATAGRPDTATLPQPTIRPATDEQAVQESLAASHDEPLLPAVVSPEPDVEVAAAVPPLPVAVPVRSPVRTIKTRSPASSQPAAGTKVKPAPSTAPPSRTQVQSAAPATAASTAPKIDLAPLERHLQILTDQSFRYGTDAKRARLVSTRETFLTRLRTCDTDACKRDAYLRRNAEVGEIMRN